MIKFLILNIATGAFVAGIDAGKVYFFFKLRYNTWPLMNDEVIPTGIIDKDKPLWTNFF